MENIILSFFVNLIIFLVVIFMWVSVIRFVLGIKSDRNFSKSLTLFLKYLFQFLICFFNKLSALIRGILVQILTILKSLVDMIIEKPH